VSEGLRRDLARLIGAESVVAESGHRPYRHDATIQRGLVGEPDAVVRPADARAVAKTLRWCYEHEVALVPRGGGTGLAGGAVPVGGGVVVSLERLRRVRMLDPGLWRMSVEAGVRTADVARLARENGLMFAPDPGGAEQSQIGGNVATNAGGPHAFKYGRTGAFVSGLEVALAPGELARLGRAGRRDASGYDLPGLLVGSEGTLGIVTAVDLHLVPAPPLARALVVWARDIEDAQRALLNILASGVQPAVLDFIDVRAFAAASTTFPGRARRGPLLLVEVDGGGADVERALRELAESLSGNGPPASEEVDARALWRWRDGMNGAVSAVRGGKVSEDICVPPERLAQTLAGVYEIGEELALPSCAWGHAGDGIVHATFMIDPSDPDDPERGRRAGECALALALRMGGSVTGEHGVGWVKRELLATQWDAATLAAQERVKLAFDPKGLLNPGKKRPPAPDGRRGPRASQEQRRQRAAGAPNQTPGETVSSKRRR
jgi:glycolate oxidase subunit GlcD